MNFFPGFKATCVVVGLLFMLLSLILFIKGLMAGMAEFNVPQPVLDSPHYYDAIKWVYTHMAVLGLLILTIGFSVSEPGKQKWVALLLTGITAYYTKLDLATSDSSLGNGLYQGQMSVLPAIISAITCLLFLQVTIQLFKKRRSPVHSYQRF